MNLYTTTDLYRFEQRCEEKIDSILDDPDYANNDYSFRDRAAHQITRLRNAAIWLHSMQRYVHTDAQVIELDCTTLVTLFDFYLLDKDVKVKS